MGSLSVIVCDGCGQNASPEHLAARFRRLEWSTRYRPLHINALLLGAVPPANDVEFIYSDADVFGGEAEALLQAAGIATAGKAPEAIHHEFQRAGFFVAYVLDCPIEAPADSVAGLRPLLAKRIPTMLTRIRRSIKPKRVALIAPELDLFVGKFTSGALDCGVILDGAGSFRLTESSEAIERLRSALTPQAALR